jgi:hypothetical protein
MLCVSGEVQTDRHNTHTQVDTTHTHTHTHTQSRKGDASADLQEHDRVEQHHSFVHEAFRDQQRPCTLCRPQNSKQLHRTAHTWIVKQCTRKAKSMTPTVMIEG